VLSPRGDFTARVHATGRPADVGPVDHVFLGLKANSYAACGPLTEPLLRDGTTIIAARNGIPWWYFHRHGGPYDGQRIESVDPGGAVSAVLAPERAVGCVVHAAAEPAGPGVVRHLEGTRFSIGEPDRSVSARCLGFSEAMREGGLKVPGGTGAAPRHLDKLLGTISFNPISALTRAAMREMCHHRTTREVIGLMMTETPEVADALGCRPEISVERRPAGAERAGDHRTSTLQDLEKGKPLELDVLLAAVVELAGITGVPVPTLRTVAAVSDLPATRSAA
jgi:2-dehydropantoate 2-reductase